MFGRIAVVLVTGALVLAGCGGDSQPPETTSSPAADLNIGLTDFRFAPALWTLQSNTAAELQLTNRGSFTHDWTVLASPIDVESDFDESLVLSTFEVNVGAQVAVTISPLPAGTYQVICSIPTHFSQGMVGTLTVE